MSNPDIKSLKRNATRAASPKASSTSSSKSRKLTSKKASHKPIPKRSAAGKAPVRKADKSSKAKSSAAKSSAVSKTKTIAKPKASPKKGSTKTLAPTKKTKTLAKSKPSAKSAKTILPAQPKTQKESALKKKVLSVPKAKLIKPEKERPLIAARPVTPRPQNRPSSHDTASALKAFESAHKEFTKGNFAEAKKLFRFLVDQFVNVSEVVARAHTYLRIAESRLQTEAALPHDADSLYDHGVIELNRGQYATAKEMFERALQISPKAAHIHYGLASTFLRMEIKDLALQSLEQAINLDSYFRIRAQQDPDLALLREEPDFERIVFNDR